MRGSPLGAGHTSVNGSQNFGKAIRVGKHMPAPRTEHGGQIVEADPVNGEHLDPIVESVRDLAEHEDGIARHVEDTLAVDPGIGGEREIEQYGLAKSRRRLARRV